MVFSGHPSAAAQSEFKRNGCGFDFYEGNQFPCSEMKTKRGVKLHHLTLNISKIGQKVKNGVIKIFRTKFPIMLYGGYNVKQIKYINLVFYFVVFIKFVQTIQLYNSTITNFNVRLLFF